MPVPVRRTLPGISILQRSCASLEQIDEDGHRTYLCDLARALNITGEHMGRRLVFIRVNTDPYYREAASKKRAPGVSMVRILDSRSF